MSPLLQGIQLGLLLALLVGPLLIALLQASLEHGTPGGLTVAAGIWFSDLLFILLVYFGVGWVLEWVAWDGFEPGLGVLGAVVLLFTGLSTLLTPPPELEGGAPAARSGTGLWLTGFLINTLNPFTVFFWVSVMTGIVAEEAWRGATAWAFFAGLLGTIVFTDTLKVLSAKRIRHRLRREHVRWIRRISGTALIVFAIVLVVRVIG